MHRLFHNHHSLRLLLPLAVCTLLWSACSGDFFEQTIELEQPDYDKQLVVHTGIGQNYDIWDVAVKRNYGILQSVPDSAWYVQGATVKILENGQVVLQATPNQQSYQTVIPTGLLKSGHTYELNVSHPEFPAISAFQTIPGAFQVDSARFRQNGGVDMDGINLSAVEVFLQDDGAQENFYYMEVFRIELFIYELFDPTTGLTTVDTFRYVYEAYPWVVEDPNAEITSRAVLVSDQFFNGQAYKFSFKMTRTSTNIPIQYNVVVRSITKDLYLYLVSEQARIEAEDNPLAEPVSVYSNLNNGIGIFALYHEQQYLIDE